MQKLTAQEEVKQLLASPQALRPPAWRFTVAQHAVANPIADLTALGTADRWLLDGALFYRESRLKELDKKRRIPKLQAQMRYAYEIYLSGMVRGTRWALEAMILSGASDEKIADKTKLPIDIITVYRKMFYDVELFIGDPEAVIINVLPMSYNRVNQGMTWDLGWKLAAIDHGWDGLLRAIRGELDGEQVNRMFQRQLSNAMSGADLMLHDRATGFNEQALAVVNVANKYWDLSMDSKNLAKNAQQAAAESFFNALVPIVDTALKTATPTQETAEALIL